MPGSSQPEDRLLSASHKDATAGTEQFSAADGEGAIGNSLPGSRAIEGTELDAALQLLVDRAQYITGATGTALALPEGEEMVCRASAGDSAPAVGARLQVRSGLTGESIARRQLLRCDNAETDPRVNLETCRALGIASIVVLPLLRRTGEVRGLFELFSDHPYAFEERDLVALERMADLTSTALDLAEQTAVSAAAPAARRGADGPVVLPTASSVPPAVATPVSLSPDVSRTSDLAEPSALSAAADAILPSSSGAAPTPALVRDADVVPKCAACGFPVSEGRTLCLDCEKKNGEETNREEQSSEDKLHLPQSGQIEPHEIKPNEREQGGRISAATSATNEPEEFVPAFLVNSLPAQKSWLTNPVNLLAIVVLILCVLVAVVVFR